MGSTSSTETAEESTMAVRPVTADELELLVHGGHGHPHAVLGPHTARRRR